MDLKGYELLHLGWMSGKKVFSLDDIDLSSLPAGALDPKTVTAAFVGLKSKITLFKFTKSIREYSKEAISAVIPGIALSELWSIVGLVDKGFQLLSWIIIAISQLKAADNAQPTASKVIISLVHSSCIRAPWV